MQQRGGALPKEWQSWPKDPEPRKQLAPKVCGNCQLYTRCAINPEAAIGSCQIGHLSHFPEERHPCRDHQPI